MQFQLFALLNFAYSTLYVTLLKAAYFKEEALMANLFKHLNESQRRIISHYLDLNSSLFNIANIIGKHSSSISREIKNNRTLVTTKAKKINKCGNYNICLIKHLCNDCLNGKCKFCSRKQCDVFCSEFTPIPNCKKTKKFPFVCNGCQQAKDCKLPKYFYNASNAQNLRNDNVRLHKFGIKIRSDELILINDIISKGVLNKQSIEVIINTNNINYSTSTIYKYIRAKCFDIDLMDLKKVVNRRPTKKKNNEAKNIINQDYLVGRTYDEYLIHLKQHTVTNIWQMDTVKGKQDGSDVCLLTLLHTTTNLQLLFRLDACTQKEIARVFNHLKTHFNEQVFSEIFEVIITDNGSEFKDPVSLSSDIFKQKELIKIFYAQPFRADQKAKCEKNHVHIREFIPKGVDIEPYTISDLYYISNQINNYSRKIFGFKSPIQQLENHPHKKMILELNNLHELQPQQVNLSRIIK